MNDQNWDSATHEVDEHFSEGSLPGIGICRTTARSLGAHLENGQELSPNEIEFLQNLAQQPWLNAERDFGEICHTGPKNYMESAILVAAYATLEPDQITKLAATGASLADVYEVIQESPLFEMNKHIAIEIGNAAVQQGIAKGEAYDGNSLAEEGNALDGENVQSLDKSWGLLEEIRLQLDSAYLGDISDSGIDEISPPHTPNTHNKSGKIVR